MFRYILLIVVLIFILASNESVAAVKDSTTNFTKRVCEMYVKPGHVMIGGMFPIYESRDNPCDGGIQEYAISLVESMIYAVDLINNRDDILQNITLGYEIRNDCGNEDIALWTMLTMTSPSGYIDYAETCPNFIREESDRVLAVIGPGLSSTSLLAAKVGRVYAIPIISFSATSDELSNTQRFPFFFRTVPPDRFQVGAIIDLLKRYNWRYIALFYSIDAYGIHGARQIQSLAEKYDICIAINMPVSKDSSISEENEITEKLRSSDKVSVIVLFAVSVPAKTVLRAIKGIDRKFTLIGSDSWGPDKGDLGGLLPDGALFVRFSRVSLTEFEEYYEQLPQHPDNTSQWYRSYLNEIALEDDCTDGKSCRTPQPHPIAKRIINGVHAIAYALDTSLQGTCAAGNGSRTDALSGWTLKDNLQGVSFMSGLNETFQFDNNGDVSGRYELKNWQSRDGVYQLVKIGIWDPDNVAKPLRLNEDLIDWGTYNGEVPRSLCIKDCEPGYISVPLTKKCCLGCQRCPSFAIVINSNGSSTAMCLKCPITHWPDATFTECVTITPSYISYQSLVYILSSAGAGFGLILSGIAAIGLCYYSQHALIKASSRELSCINIIGLAFSCVVVLLILLRPATITCIIVDVCTTTCVCMIFSPVLLKVNRIWRIFNATKGKRPLYTSSQHQLSIAAMLIILEVLIACSCIYFAPSQPEIILPAFRKPYLEIYCQLNYGFLASCSYNMLIIIACCYFAFRARNVPSNYNESKFIALSVYSTLIVCLAAIPVYTTAIDVSQKVLTLTVALLFNTYLTLACLYLPKIYAIHFAGEDAQQSWRLTTENASNATTTGRPAVELDATNGNHQPKGQI